MLITQKMKLAALVKKLKVRVEARKRYNNNKLYYANKKAFYANLRTGPGSTKEIADPPSKEDITEFWGKLWSNKGAHNPNAKWLQEERNEMSKIPRDKWDDFSTETLTATTKKISNWKSPGLDQVQNLWINLWKHSTPPSPKPPTTWSHAPKRHQHG